MNGRGIHFLSHVGTDGGMCHGSERKPVSQGDSRTVRPKKKKGGEEEVKSVLRKKESRRARGTHVLSSKSEGQSGERMKTRGQGALTLCRAQTEERVRNQDSERKLASEEYSRTSSSRRGNIRTAKASRRARGTHVQALSSTQGGTTLK